MINGKNMFTYKIRKIGLQKESNNIIPDDPSNIFEFTNKKRKLINFDDILGKKHINFEKENKNKQSNVIEKESKNKQSKVLEKKSKVIEKKNNKVIEKKRVLEKKKVDFNTKENIKNIEKKLKVNVIKKEEAFKKNIPTSSTFPSASTFLDDSIEVLTIKNKVRDKEIEEKNKVVEKEQNKVAEKEEKSLSINDCVSLNDVILLFCLNNHSEYSSKLKDIILNDRSLFNDTHEAELREIERKIEEQDTQKDKWFRIKKEVEEENLVEIPTYTPKQLEVESGDIDISKIRFIKENMKAYLSNLNDRLSEAEQKIFNLTGNDREMDPLILLNALTKYN